MFVRPADFPSAHEALAFSVHCFEKAFETSCRKTQLTEVINRVGQIGSCLTRYAPSLADQIDCGFMIKLAGILWACPVCGVGVREDTWLVLTLGQHDRQLLRYINVIDHFARIDFCENVGRFVWSQAKCTPDAGAAGVESEHQSRIFWRAAINVGVNAEGTMITSQESRFGFGKLKPWAPHQGAIGEYPSFVFARFGHHRQDKGCQQSLDLAGACAS